MPDVGALRGPAPSFNDLATPDNNIPSMTAEKVINCNKKAINCNYCYKNAIKLQYFQ